MGSGHEEFSLFGVSLKQQCLIVKAFLRYSRYSLFYHFDVSDTVLCYITNRLILNQVHSIWTIYIIFLSFTSRF